MPPRSLRTALSLTTLMALVATPLAMGFTAPASANPLGTGLVISEAYGGGGNAGAAYRADFVELYNPTSSPITMSNWSIQYRSSSSAAAPAASGITVLNGTVPAHGYFLVREATGGNAALPDLPTADVTGTIAMSGTAFQVWLANTTTAQNPPAGSVGTGNSAIVDFVGVSAASYEGTAAAPGIANATSANRVDAAGVQSPPTDSDRNSVDFKTLDPTPKNSTNRFPEVVALGATDPGDKTVYLNRAMTPFTLAATGGTPPYTWTATGTPAGITVDEDGTVSGTPTALGTSTVTATATDAEAATASAEFDIVVSELPVKPLKTIPEIQGTGDTSPLAGQDVSVEGVVTARYPDGGLNGYVIQTAGYDPEDDTTPNASDALFVYFGAATTAPYAIPAIGDHVTILNGRVSEFSGITEITVTNGDFVDTRPATPGEAVVPGTVIPGTECEQGDCPTAAEIDVLREAHEHEAFLPAGPHTVTDSYSGGVGSSAMRGEFRLALNSDKPLYIPLELATPQQTALRADIADFNAAHGVVLDDGSTVSFSASIAYPWLTLTNTVRGGAAATFVKPVVLDYRFGTWRLQPSNRIQPGNDGSGQVAFEQDRPAAPDDVLGDEGNLKIATFNMLNYFVHAAQDWDNLPDDAVGTNRSCTYYNDRAGVRLTANTCTWKDLRNNPPSTLPDIGPRGAATETSLLRQEVKEVAAINTMDADVMSLEEVENPVKIGYADRDAALKRLVDALNADYDTKHPGEDPAALGKRWAFVPTPRPEALPTIAEQDAIRSAFIYNPRAVATVGRSEVLVNAPAFRNAREPLAQGFRHIDGSRDDAFLVVVNHFKSKSAPDDPSTIAGTDNEDTGNGSGSYNGDRVRQARALDAFADSVAEDKGISAVFMTGDYNAYSSEDPVTTLESLGWNPLGSDNGETSYFFGGLAGSLDHVFANDAASDLLQGATIWPINANEPVYYEYSRFNYNVTPLYDETAFRSSDHNPEIIGIKAPTSDDPAPVDTVQVLASNDFHGRLLDDPSSASAGAAAMAGAVKGLRSDNPNTTFVMAGDIVGASTFESFIQNDKPTIDAMNEAGLEVSAAGNHEFDQGYDDLMDRIMSATAEDGGASWPYIAANVRDEVTGDYALKSDRTDGNFEHANGATWWKEFDGLNGADGIRVGFVGAVTEDLDSLVAPSAIDGLEITSIVDEVNAAAADLKDEGCGGEACDLVIELVHEGAPSPSCDTIRTDEDSTFGRIVHEASTDVDAIVSGHTHLKYNCKVAVDGKPLDRPVVSAGQYGSYLNQLEFDFEPGTANLVGIRQHVLAMKNYDEDADTKAIVNAAVEVANVKGAVELGQVAGAFKRARRVDPTSGVVENRGGESTLGNEVAEIQRWKTGADIGVMNPGGLRDDLIGTGDGAGPVTYREAANVQPFANTLVTVDLTGAQLKLLLEQQWQRDPDNNIPSRPFLRLGTSKGFTWTEDSSRAEGNRITGMWLNGVAIAPAGTYTVSANSFIATGGDNFRALTLGSNKRDTGFTDLQATVEYLDEYANVAEGDAPLPVDYSQHGVGAKVPAGPFSAGQTVTIPLDSLSMTGGGTTSADITDVTDAAVVVSYGATDLGTFPVTTALPATPYDIPGAATVTFPLPSGLAGGTQWFTVTGAATGTTAKVPVTVVDTRADSTVSGTAADITYGQAGTVAVTVTPAGAGGTVELYDGATRIGEGTLTGGATTIAVPAGTLGVGVHPLTLRYSGDDLVKPAEGTVDVTVVKAAATVTATPTPASVVQDSGTSSIAVAVTATGTTPTGSVSAWLDGTQLAEATLVAGQATLQVGPFATVGTQAIEVRYSGSTSVDTAARTVSVVVTAKPTPQPTATTVTGTDTSVQWAKAGSVAISVAPAAATGTVELYDGTTKLGTATLSGGAASIALAARSLEVGSHVLVVRYLGSTTHAASQDTVTVTVTKAKPKVKVDKPKKITAGEKAKVKVRVGTEGYDATGKVRIVLKGAGRTITVTEDLVDGDSVARIKVGRPGKYKVTVTYLGDEHTLRGTDSTHLRVKK